MCQCLEIQTNAFRTQRFQYVSNPCALWGSKMLNPGARTFKHDKSLYIWRGGAVKALAHVSQQAVVQILTLANISGMDFDRSALRNEVD